MTLTAFDVKPLPPGPFVGCTWGGSRAYGPAITGRTPCEKEARWVKVAILDDGATWFLCDRHRDSKIDLRGR